MSAEAFVFATLSAAAGVITYVGAGSDARIYPDEAKEGTALPLIVYDQGSTQFERALNDEIRGTHTTIAITAWASTRFGAEQLAGAVISAMAAVNEVPTSQDSDYDEVNQAYAAVVTFEIWNR